jgi:hypothetical protein
MQKHRLVVTRGNLHRPLIMLKRIGLLLDHMIRTADRMDLIPDPPVRRLHHHARTSRQDPVYQES